jgi:hypothetical protein
MPAITHARSSSREATSAATSAPSEQFPDTYPMYKSSTKMLVPFIF